MGIYWLLQNHYCETEYLSGVLKYLDINKYEFVVTDNLESLPVYGPNVVAIVTSDEEYHVPEYLDKIKMTFKHYVNQKLPKLMGIPLGYVNGFKSYPMVDVDKRPIDVFFSGQPTGINRQEMMVNVLNFSRKHHHLNVQVGFTNGFRRGYSAEEHSKLLYDSKIALCPAGVKCAESFRFFEATKAGCIVITVKQPQENYAYIDSPAIQLNDWSEFGNVMTELLIGRRNVFEIQKQTINKWITTYSEEAVGKRIMQELGE